MRGLLAQLAPTDGSLEANIATVEAVLGARPHVDLAVFPELFLPGYRLGEARELACEAEGEEIGRLRAAAAEHRTAVIVGFAERMPTGAIANSAACIDADGALAGVYRKTHLFGERERRAFHQGEELLLVELAGRRVGPLICFDVEFPEPARALAKAGADLIVTIAANMKPYRAEHALAARARALDNRCPHLYVNRVGACEGIEFVGGSAAIDSSGCAVAATQSVTPATQGGVAAQTTETAVGAWAPAGTESLAGTDPPAGTEQPAGAQAPAASQAILGGMDAAGDGGERERLLEVEVPPAWVDVGSDIDYLEHSRRDLPVRIALSQGGVIR